MGSTNGDKKDEIFLETDIREPIFRRPFHQLWAGTIDGGLPLRTAEEPEERGPVEEQSHQTGPDLQE